jgi:hypothetical protein
MQILSDNVRPLQVAVIILKCKKDNAYLVGFPAFDAEVTSSSRVWFWFHLVLALTAIINKHI